MTEPRHPKYSCTTGGALRFWFAIFALLYGSLLLLARAVPGLHAYGATFPFAAAGIACLANLARNRTFHCTVTGPFFLLIGVVAALDPGGLWRHLSPFVLPGVLVVVGAALLLERHFAV